MLKNRSYKITSFCFLVVTLLVASCGESNFYKENKQYRYLHYPNSVRVPNSRYYGRPYELTPQKRYPYSDFDYYYAPPYGYDEVHNNSGADSKL